MAACIAEAREDEENRSRNVQENSRERRAREAEERRTEGRKGSNRRKRERDVERKGEREKLVPLDFSSVLRVSPSASPFRCFLSLSFVLHVLCPWFLRRGLSFLLMNGRERPTASRRRHGGNRGKRLQVPLGGAPSTLHTRE
jgi:hypothetical protein